MRKARIYIRAEPKEGNEHIKKDDIARLEKEIRIWGTKIIQLKDVKLFCDSYVTEIAALKPDR